MAYVVDPVFQHGDALGSHAKGEAGVPLGVVAHTFQDLGMNHPGAHYLDPSAVTADSAPVAVAFAGKTVDGHIDAGLHKGEIVAAKAYLTFFAKHPAGKFIQCAFEVSESDAFANGQAFHLVEMPFVGGVGSLVPVALARHDHSYRRFPVFHNPGLHR